MEAAPRPHRPGQKHFPLSPPQSPAARKRHRKKASEDPFLRLGHPASQSLIASPPSSPPNEADIPEEPLYKRIILTPLLFTSFLVSLFLIDTQNAVSRTKSSSLFSFLDPEPYQDPYDSRWDRRDSMSHATPPDSSNLDRRSGTGKRKRRSWYLHRKIRKIAKLEISDAFEMRGRVMIAMVIICMMALYIAWYCFRQISSMF